MDSSNEASKNKKQEDTPSSPQPPSPGYSCLGDLNSLSPITFEYEDNLLLDELLFNSTPPSLTLSPSSATQLFESDINGGESLFEDPCNTKNLNLLLEEPNTVHQEKPSNVEEPAKIQDDEWLSSEMLHFFQECENYGEMKQTLDVEAEDFWRDDSEASQNLRDLTCCIEAASNPFGNILPLSPHISEVPVTSVPSPVTSSKPSSGVLHLNSLLKATTGMGSTEGLKSKRLKYRLTISPYIPGIPTVQVSTINDEFPEIDADFDTSESPSFIEPFTFPSCPETANVHAGNSEEFNQPRPKTTKKRSINADTEGCIGCTCKRSACAKLYCECFAAELYCGEPCSCLGCLNRPEFRDKIYKIRNQIKSRDQFAFASKLVQINDIDIPSNNTEHDTMKTLSSSARHRKGCNCMKSKCLKNYCECFENEVGCTRACQCQGCENSYGKKEGENQQDDMNKERESGRVEEGSDLLHTEREENDVHGLLPITPSLQCSEYNLSRGPHRPQSSPVTPMTRLREITNHSSGGLVKKGRKYILNNVLSFPPLTLSDHHEEDSGDKAREPDKRL